MASSISCIARARTGTGTSDRRRPATNSASARAGGVAVLAAAWPAALELSREVMAASSQSAGRAPSEYRIECASAPRAWVVRTYGLGSRSRDLGHATEAWPGFFILARPLVSDAPWRRA